MTDKKTTIETQETPLTKEVIKPIITNPLPNSRTIYLDENGFVISKRSEALEYKESIKHNR
ncbi:MAG: hypothetical protein ACOYUZ_01385 [Patescibacteria group bacterium]